MSLKTIIILSVNTVLAVWLIKILFKTFKEFLKSIYYIFCPNIVSLLKKDYENDFTYTHKLLFLILILVGIVFMEFFLFYAQ